MLMRYLNIQLRTGSALHGVDYISLSSSKGEPIELTYVQFDNGVYLDYKTISTMALEIRIVCDDIEYTVEDFYDKVLVGQEIGNMCKYKVGVSSDEMFTIQIKNCTKYDIEFSKLFDITEMSKEDVEKYSDFITIKGFCNTFIAFQGASIPKSYIESYVDYFTDSNFLSINDICDVHFVDAEQHYYRLRLKNKAEYETFMTKLKFIGVV